MKKITIVLALLLTVFVGVSEAKITRPIVGTSVSLNGITLAPGESIPLFIIDSAYHWGSICIHIPTDPGYVRIINTNTNSIVTSGGASCSFGLNPLTAGTLILENRPDNNTTTVSFGADAYFVIQMME